MLLPLISVIITTRNEEENLGFCLESIKKQTFPSSKVEVIVVDNNSTDKTKQIAKKYTPKIYNQGPERSAQRNFGAQKARGKWLLFLDADTILSSKAIKKGLKKGEKERLVGLYIAEIILGNSFWCQVRRFERSFYDVTPIDAVRLIRADIFRQIGGFDRHLTGPEDWDLDKRVRALGKTALIEPSDFFFLNRKLNKFNYEKENFVSRLNRIASKAVVYHNEINFSLKEYLKKKSYYAANFSVYLEKWGKNDPDLKRQLGFFYRYFWVFLRKGGGKKIIRFPHLAFGMIVLKFLTGLTYLKTKAK